MKAIKYLAASVVFTLLNNISIASFANTTNSIVIRSIKGDPDFGNVCVFSLPNQRDIFVAGKTSEKLGAAMNIDGKEVFLKFVSVKLTKARKPITANYAINDIKVRVDFTSIPSPRTETRKNVSHYRGNIKVTRGKKSVTVQAKGLCDY